MTPIRILRLCSVSLVVILAASLATADSSTASADLSPTPAAQAAAEAVIASLPADYRRLGQLAPRGARDIGFSLLGIGGETLDRDYADFHAWKHYLEPLGAKWVRLQSGWAKTEPTPGHYDHAWLDEVIDGCRERGVEPWLELSYGNPIYPGGGLAGLFGGLIRGELALTAWDNYVRTTVRRYRDRVRVFEIWNEADANANRAEPGEYAALFRRTALIIREEHPEAFILGLALAHVDEGANGSLRDFVETLASSDDLGLVDGITVHGYPKNPDDLFAELTEIRGYLDTHSPGTVIWQGETGASAVAGAERAPFPVDWGIPWTELSQAKWNLRRALSHIARDMPYSQFAMTDITYTQSNLRGSCPMGLLATRDDLSIAKPRLAYFAYRNTCGLFADGLRTSPTGFSATSSHKTLEAFRFYDPHRGKHLISLWDNREVPDNGYNPTPVAVTLGEVRITRPVMVDLLTGQVFEIPAINIQREGMTLTVRDFPLWDSPRLICDRSLIALIETHPTES